jgi:Ca2+-binding RTX toxin-like protein
MRFQIRTMLAAGILAAGLAATTGAAQASPPYKVTRGTLVVLGTNANDRLALRLQAGNPKKLEIDFDDDGSADVRVNRKRIDRIRIKALGGSDQVRIDDVNGAIRIPTRIDGGRGDDTLLGGHGRERFHGGPGNDTIDGNRGADTADLGAGDDRFIWDPGDGSDAVDGRLGHDALAFKGSSADERFAVSADGRRARVTRDVGNIRMDLRRVDQVDVAANAGDDTLKTYDLAATEVRTVNEDLGTGTDHAIVNATNADDDITAAGSASVTGLAAAVNIRSAEGLTVNALGGDDVVDANGLDAGVKFTADGGADDDRLAGGRGADRLLGGDGDDTADGNQGDDTALLGAGDDTFVWDPGDGSDTIEGQTGTDKLTFNGANLAENFDISANGGRVRFFRNVANITMDLNDVERIDTNALGGADTMVVNDLSGTDVTAVRTDVSGPTDDGAQDQVVVTGTNGDDVATATGAGGSASVLGLAARVDVTHANATTDDLTINALAGADVIEASGLAADTIRLTANGGDGDDVLTGGAGADTLLGRAGDDVLIGGAGNDTLDGGPGDNIVIQ